MPVKPSSLLTWLQRILRRQRVLDVPSVPPIEQRWACDFECDKPMLEILTVLNAAGPWRWEVRDKEAFGDYLACAPAAGLSVRLYDVDGYYSNGPTYTVDFQRLRGCELAAAAVEAIIGKHLELLGATNITPAEYWD